MLMVLQRAQQEDNGEYPEQIVRLDEHPGYKQIFKKVKSFITEQAENAGLLPENLASKKQINQFLTCHFKLNSGSGNQTVELLIGWRKALFGEKLSLFTENNFE